MTWTEATTDPDFACFDDEIAEPSNFELCEEALDKHTLEVIQELKPIHLAILLAIIQETASMNRIAKFIRRKKLIHGRPGYPSKETIRRDIRTIPPKILFACLNYRASMRREPNGSD